MKIALLGPVSTPSYFGGVATFNENLALAFEKLGHEVIIFTRQADLSATNDLNVNVKRISLVSNLFSDDYDYVICSLAYIALLPFIKSNKKIYFFHGFFSVPSYGLLKSVLAVLYQKLFLSFADCTIGNSKFTQFMNRECANINIHKNVFLGVSYSFLSMLKSYRINSIEREPNTLLYVGRLTKAKNVVNIIKAIKFLERKTQKSYKLYIIGDGQDKQSLESFAKQNKLDVEFLGRQSQEEIVKYYKKSEIFISLNPSEPYGITFCEALLSGCKIICPVTGGQSEILAEYTDRTVMVDYDNIEQIGDAVNHLVSLDNPSDLDLDKFSYERTANEILSIVDEIIDSKVSGAKR